MAKFLWQYCLRESVGRRIQTFEAQALTGKTGPGDRRVSENEQPGGTLPFVLHVGSHSRREIHKSA